MSGMAALAKQRHHRNAEAIASAPSAMRGVPVVHLHALIESMLLSRAQHVAAVEAIDAELTKAYEQLGEDRRVRIPATPTPRSARAKRIRAEALAAPKWPRGATADADVLKAIEWGIQKPRQLWARLDWGQSAIKAAIGRLLASNRILKHGSTWTLHFTVAPTPTVMPGTTTREVDGVTYEVWTPHRDAPSLIGDRPTRR